ncbi:MAG: HAD family hydrolase [Chloroflexi bacterium]|nr:HAD family hydrolase [Chloroflexota bacterium]
MIHQPEAILFDMDGTILDWTTGMEESWLESCEKHHDPSWPHAPARLHDAIRARRTWFWSDAARAARGRMDLDGASREIVRHAFADLGLDAADVAHDLADYYRALRSAAIAPYPGAIETLAAFRERGIPLALITNGEARNQRRSVVQHQLERFFDCIVIEGEFGVGKPDERVFRHALAAVGCDPEAAWMVGDSLEADIAPAVALGIHTVWVDETGAGLPARAPARPHRIVRAISELVG